MKYECGMMKDVQIAYIGGGSRGWAWGLMSDLALDGQLLGRVRLYDIDKTAAQKNRIIGEKISAHKDAKSHWEYEVADSLPAALHGADFVIISILPGTFDEMGSDVHGPEAYGVWQSVGDTVGPGGFMRALRTIPMYVEIAQAIRDHSPDAWVINYTNPMSLCIRTLYEVFPGIKAFGCCHEVFGTQRLLASMLHTQKGIDNVARQDIKVNVLGINHFTWFDKVSYQDMDLFPIYRDFVGKYHTTGYEEGSDNNWMNNSFSSAQRVKMDLFQKYGLIAAAGDRHLAEFMPPWYLESPESVREWKFGLTTVDWRIKDLENRLARRERLVSGEEEVKLNRSGEEGHLLMKALLGMNDAVSNVNIQNSGQIANLPLGAIVETNALFRRNEIAPVAAGSLPGNVLALVSRHVTNQENTLRAAMNCDYALGLTTFMNDPLMSRVRFQEGERLFQTMLQNTKKFLPPKWHL